MPIAEAKGTSACGDACRPALNVSRPESQMRVNELLKVAVDAGASDLHLKVGSFPMMRVRGLLVPTRRRKSGSITKTSSR